MPKVGRESQKLFNDFKKSQRLKFPNVRNSLKLEFPNASSAINVKNRFENVKNHL